MRKIAVLIFAYSLLFLSCTDQKDKTSVDPKALQEKVPVALERFKGLSVNGDFNGDGVQEIVYEQLLSAVSEGVIESFPSTSSWEEIVMWCIDNKVESCLSMKDAKTLFLGPSAGLLCLINLGDTNGDNRDEIAVVIRNLDFSNVSSCSIYSNCNNYSATNHWTLLKQFGINELAFDYSINRDTVWQEISGFLEKRNGKWTYDDNYLEASASDLDAKKMIDLVVEKCKESNKVLVNDG